MDLHASDDAEAPHVEPSSDLGGALERLIASCGAEPVRSRAPAIQRAAGEYFFDPMGPSLVARGWSVFPQTRGERRGPALIDGRGLAWKPFADRLPTDRDVSWWAIQAPSHNVAAIMGRASGGALALDIDVTDAGLNAAIQNLADEILGLTDFRRYGSHPKVALLYRQAWPDEDGDDAELIPNRSWRFVDGEPDEDGRPRQYGGIEVLARGKPITFYGNHHKTGRYFSWAGLHPLYHGPEALPLVTREQVERFVEAVQKLRPFHRGGGANPVDTRWTFDPEAGLHAPRAMASEEWATDPDGIVVDGREAFLFRLCSVIVRRNEAAVRGGRQGMGSLCALAEERFRALAEVSGRWADDGELKGEIADKMQRLVREAIAEADAGKRSFQSPVTLDPETNVSTFAEARHEAAVAVEAEKAGDLSWANEAVRRAITDLGAKRLPQMRVIPATPASAAAAAMMHRQDRFAAGRKAAEAVAAAADEAFAFAYRTIRAGGWRPPADDPKAKMPIHGIIAPTGAGKTRAVIRSKIRTRAANPDVHVNTAILVPTHANAAEIADAVGVHERELDEAVAEAKRAGMKVLHFKGRIAAGCGYASHMEALYAANLPGNRLCRTNDKDRETGERVEVLCKFYDACPHRLMLEELKSGTVDLTLMPHAYLTGPMAKEVSENVHHAVVDETHWRAVSGTKTFPVAVLQQARALPKLTEKDHEEGIYDPQFLVMRRDYSVRVLLDARDAGIDPAQAFKALNGRKAVTLVSKLRRRTPKLGGFSLGAPGPSKPVSMLVCDHRGRDLIDAARRCVDASRNAGSRVKPNMTEDELAAAVDVAHADHADGEGALWKLILDRYEDLVKDADDAAMHAAAVANGHADEAPVRRVQAPYDTRIQFGVMVDEKTKEQVDSIRVTYWKKRNFLHMPTLLIDASMSERITEHAWPGRQPVIFRIDAPVHARTILVADGTGSDGAVLPGKGKSGKGKLQAAARAELLLALRTRVAGIYANGGVLESYTKAVRAFVEGSQAAAPNVDVLHQGNTRGYNFAESHSALLSYGRLEYPIQAIDAYKALFTFNDPNPEPAWDALGTGLDKAGKPIQAPQGEREILMRDGSKRVYGDMMFPEGSWAREVQEQLREEELRQTLGRLRPVYRIDSDAVWINVGRCVPAGIVVDEIVSLVDLVRPGKVDHIFEAARRSHGVLSPQGARTLQPDLALYRVGQTSPLKRLVPREMEGLVKVRWAIQGSDEPVERLMLNYIDDLEEAAWEFCRQAGWRMVPGSFEVVGQRPSRIAIGHKRPDRQDLDRAGLTLGQADDIVEERGVEGLRLYVMQLDREREEARRARALKRVTRELGRVPHHADWLGLPMLPDVPRAMAKGTLTTRMLVDAGEWIDGGGDED